MQTLTIEQKIGQLFFIGISGPELDRKMEELIDDIKPGGICLFARNIKTAEQTRRLLDGLREVSLLPPFLSVDQEGGLVDRLRRILTPMPSASRIRNKEEASEFGRIVSDALKILGFNMDFAPVVDVITHDRESLSNGLFSRGFGRTSAQVTELASAFVRELQKGGIIPCLKHFPGIGAATVDSHEELPQVDIEESEFRTVDLAPYLELLHSDKVSLVMIGHAAYPRLALQDKDLDGRLLPSSLNGKFVNGLLRDELEYKGVAVTDDLEMGAILRNYGIGEACRMAVNAGNDMLAICANESSVREGFSSISEAVRSGAIDEARIDLSISRIDRLRSEMANPAFFDPHRVEALSDRIEDLNSRLT